jgi:LAGLIDADG endonuclease
MTKQSKFSYLAGFMDGEGSFSIVKTFSVQRKRDGSKQKYVTYKCMVSVTNTNKEVMDWIAKTFGGKVLTGSNENRNPRYKTRYSWFRTSHEDIERFTLGILPYLIVKRKQALVALEFCKTYQADRIGTELGPEVNAKRDELRKEMMSLNGIFPPDTLPKPVETTRKSPQTEDDDIVRPAQ